MKSDLVERAHWGITKFQDDGYPLSDEGLDHALALLDVDAATLWAVLRVETGGFGFLLSRRPVIRFERHIFDRLTDGRFRRDHPGSSNPVPGGYAGGAAEYARMEAAATLDRDAAMRSTSWGIGQLLGDNVGDTGHPDVGHLAHAMKSDEDSQLLAAVRFIEEAGLAYPLQERAWLIFAQEYNGAGFGRDNYDLKLAAAFAQCQRATPNLDIRGAQIALRYLGDPGIPVNGVLDPRTRAAVIAYQRQRRLAVTGRLDTRMIEHLCVMAFGA